MRIKDARQTFVGVWVRSVLEGKSFEVWGGAQLRDFTSVGDCVVALLLAAAKRKAEGQVYNLGGVGRISLRELARTLVRETGAGAFVVKTYPPDRRKIDIGNYYADDRRIRRELGWQPRTDIAGALRQTVDYFRTELPHYV